MVASSSSATATSAAKAPLITSFSEFYRHLRATIKTILATPDSRKIYFFLCLNLFYMFIQMAYGIWTNSLGLISDCESLFLPPCISARKLISRSRSCSHPYVL